MTAKEYLSQAHRLDQRVNNKLLQIESLRSMAEKVTSSYTFDGRAVHWTSRRKILSQRCVVSTQMKKI